MILWEYAPKMLEEITKHALEDNCHECIRLAYEIYTKLEKEKPIPKETVERFRKMMQRIDDELRPKRIASKERLLKEIKKTEKIGFEKHGENFINHPLYAKVQERKAKTIASLKELKGDN